MNPIQTLRETLEILRGAVGHADTIAVADRALAALAELEKQEPEIWKDVAGYEGLYQVSSEGRLKNIKTDHILRSASLVGSGYVKADLWKDGSKVQTTMHRVVAEAFLGNTAGMEVNHINGIKTDNRIANLEVVTRSENEQHSRDILGRLVKPVIAINLETGAETEYASIEAAGRDGFEPSCVYRCVRADHRIHKGHKFRLKNPEQLHVKHFLEAAPVAQQPQALPPNRIREIFVKCGFEANVGETDLTPYMEDVADALLAEATQPQAEAVPIGGLQRVRKALADRKFREATEVEDLLRMAANVIAEDGIIIEHMQAKKKAEAVEVHRYTGAGDTALGAKADCQFCAAPQQAEAVPPGYVLVPVELLYRVLDSEEVNAMADASDELRAMLAAAPKGQP